METQEKLYTVQEVADMFSVAYRTVLDWIAKGEMPCYRIGQGNIIRIGDRHIAEYLKSHDSKEKKNEIR